MNIPNLLTVFRILLIPLFIVAFYSDSPNNLLIAMIIFITAGITDVLDGYIARKYEMVTKLGTVLDPLADKLMLITVLACLTLADYITVWVIAIVVVKESLMILGSILILLSKYDIIIPANTLGKLTTASFYIAILLVAATSGGFFAQVFMYIAVCLAIVTFYNYVHVVKREIRKDVGE